MTLIDTNEFMYLAIPEDSIHIERSLRFVKYGKKEYNLRHGIESCDNEDLSHLIAFTAIEECGYKSHDYVPMIVIVNGKIIILKNRYIQYNLVVENNGKYKTESRGAIDFNLFLADSISQIFNGSWATGFSLEVLIQKKSG